MSSQKTLVLLAFLLANGAMAADGGGSSAGKGGEGIKYPDGTLISSDHFADDNSKPLVGEPYELTENVVKEIRRMGKILTRYQADFFFPDEVVYDSMSFPPLRWPDLSEKSDFVEKHVVGPNAKYRTVRSLKEVSAVCDPMKLKALPAGLESHLIMCTLGDTTYIETQALPENKNMTVRDFSGHLLHERGHTLEVNAEHFYLAHLNVGAVLALDIEDAQARGDRSRLSEEKFLQLQKLLVAVQALKLGESRLPQLDEGLKRRLEERTLYKVHLNGGGVVRKGAVVSDSAFVGVNSTLGEGSYAQAGSSVVNTFCDTLQLRGTLRPRFLPQARQDRRGIIPLLSRSVTSCGVAANATVTDVALYGGLVVPDYYKAYGALLVQSPEAQKVLSHPEAIAKWSPTYSSTSKVSLKMNEGAQVTSSQIYCSNYIAGLHDSDTSCSGSYFFATGSKGAKINLGANSLQLEAGAEIDGLVGSYGGAFNLGPGAKIIDGQANLASVTLGKNSTLTSPRFQSTAVNVGEQVVLDGVSSSLPLTLNFGDRVRLTGLALSGDTKDGLTWPFPYITHGPSLRFEAGTEIKMAATEQVCPSGQALKVKGKEEVSSLVELRKLCVKIKTKK